MIRRTIFAALVISFIACTAKCAFGDECKLAWDAPPIAEQVTSWKIYRGLDLLATVTTPAATLDLTTSARSTLSIVAVNIKGDSAPAILTVVPFTPRHSENLATWTPHPAKVVFLEAKPRLFASYSFPP